MKKIKVAVLFGGVSTEHEISIVSASSVIKNLDKSSYEIYPIYIDKSSNWFKYVKPLEKIDVFDVGSYPNEIKKIKNITSYLKNVDIVFPVLHGKKGEDGSIQGFLEILNIPYVGCKILSSSICMNKIYTRIILEKAHINQCKYIIINKNDNYIYIDELLNHHEVTVDKIDEIVKSKLKYPVYVKPSNSGSSIGISKAKDIQELEESLKEASKYDEEILIEQNIIGAEVECAVIGTKNIHASTIGQIVSNDNFYDYDSKYKKNTSKIIIPARVGKEIIDEIKKISIKAFKAVRGSGLSRIDFFVDKDNKIYLNEINTMPGFTKISMYPKLWEYEAKEYSHLLDELINQELENYK